MKTVITYGTFDLFHIGHLRLLERLKEKGDRLIVAVSTDEFNEKKNKRSFLPYEQRAEIVSAIRYVDMVIPEEAWEQKLDDIKKYDVGVFGIGDDWVGKFDFLAPYCEVIYLSRTSGISSTSLRQLARVFDKGTVDRLAEAQLIINALMKDFDGSGSATLNS
jgi:glycerol-3-phosphate cytidylyltransferase